MIWRLLHDLVGPIHSLSSKSANIEDSSAHQMSSGRHAVGPLVPSFDNIRHGFWHLFCKSHRAMCLLTRDHQDVASCLVQLLERIDDGVPFVPCLEPTKFGESH